MDVFIKKKGRGLMVTPDKKYKYGEIKLSDDNWLVIHKCGIIQFNQKIAGPASLKFFEC
jgi:hypothetical protein